MTSLDRAQREIGGALQSLDIMTLNAPDEMLGFIGIVRGQVLRASVAITDYGDAANLAVDDLPPTRPVQGKKPKHTTKQKPGTFTKPKPSIERQREALAIECPICHVPAGELCISVWPVRKGEVATQMHKERTGSKATVPNRHPKEASDERPVVTLD